MKCLYWSAGVCALIAGLVVVATSGAQDRSRKDATAQAAPAATDDAHAADRAAIEAVNVEFTRAFNAGDAAALAALFAEDARMSDEAGQTVEGKTAIQKRLAETFQESPGVKLVLRTDSVKFLTPDVAVEEGASQVQSPGDTDETAAEFIPYTAIFVKQDGKWLHSVVRDYIVAKADDAAAATGAEALQQLEWMVGEWVEEGSESKSISTCEWAQNRHFLVWNYTIEAEGANAPGGTSFIGWDPLTGQIKSWLFDADGGHGEATWTRHGEGQWVVKASGVLGDGRTASATQYVTRLGNDLASWTSVDRVAGGDVQPDMSEYIIARKPPRPVSAVDSPRTR
jgi:uncharacterized protein (TIGR02246 family)